MTCKNITNNRVYHGYGRTKILIQYVYLKYDILMPQEYQCRNL